MTIGEAIKRIEDPRLLVGKGQYVADVRVPGLLEACVVRSPYAHAKILGIDSSAASAIKGVVAVVTASDLPSNLQPIPMRLTPAPELAHALQMPLASNVVRYAGEPVAVIVADSRYVAEDAAEQLLVEISELPCALMHLSYIQCSAAILFTAWHRRKATQISPYARLPID